MNDTNRTASDCPLETVHRMARLRREQALLRYKMALIRRKVPPSWWPGLPEREEPDKLDL